MGTNAENEELATELTSAVKLCDAALDKLAGGPHYRDAVYEALELSKDAMERAAEALRRPKRSLTGAVGLRRTR